MTPTRRMNGGVGMTSLVLPGAMTLGEHKGRNDLAPIRGIVAELKASFEAGGIEAMSQTHSAAVKDCLFYRLLCNLGDFVFPAASLLDVAKDVDRQVGELGVAGGSSEVLKRLPIAWRVEFSARGEDEIRTCPAVVFGKHGSILTPFFIAASLGRPDLKMLAASYIAGLGPNIARTMFPVQLPIPSFRKAGRKGILNRISSWLTARLESAVDKDDARNQNRTSLGLAAEHVRAGGALLIAPDAGSRASKWRPGLGLLVARIAQGGASDGDVRLVPYRIWASIAGVYRLISRNPISRAIGWCQYRRPIRVAFGEPILLSAVIERTGLDPVAITGYLQTHYRGLGF